MNKYNGIFTAAENSVSHEIALASLKRDIDTYGDVTMGTDVEVLWMQKYAILDGGQNFTFYHADNVFPKNGLYGTDGRTVQGEWRITPANDVRILMANMTEMITMCKTFVALKQRRNPGMHPIYPYGMGVYSIFEHKDLMLAESIGLHIHLGTSFYSQAHLKNTVAALDVLLTPIIRLFEHPFGAHIRSGCGYYGDLSDYKEKPYGMEYRTLPSCIDNKEVFAGAFALAKAVTFETRNPAGNIRIEDLMQFSIDKDKQHDKGYLRVLAKKAMLFVKRKCRFYHVYSKELEALFALTQNKDTVKFYNTHEDIFSTWDIQCDLDNDKLVDALNKETILMPCTKAILGYEEDEDMLGLEQSSPREELVTFKTGDTPW